MKLPSVENLETISGPELIRRIRRTKDIDSKVIDRISALTSELTKVNEVLSTLRLERNRRHFEHSSDKPIVRAAKPA